MKYNFLMNLALSKSTARHIAVWKGDTYDDARTEQCVQTIWRSDGVSAHGSSVGCRADVRLVSVTDLAHSARDTGVADVRLVSLQDAGKSESTLERF
jgi:hypothetical protein